ncbi:hypothetical protein BigBertha_195 [Bacillus phage BigBertha]|uniref:Uncharacterized protein n=2 Tax=Bequatrovirus TaxID=1917990 RepID=A0A0K2D0T6_9CAUD|nr:hypothetical protein BigBertha_195 [Bacillus phage BigBertha]YP_009206557.1 hypothetical protein AVV02_gp202 [Bacillus phage AvesoBmore]AGY46703.1 hypothetical protein BigBertha_195 [Bacillus phage BigBertha]ALA13365.1 hypothetical protein AVESOBMORE_202 [Bacillus phage AvesoBmore]ULF48820.1 hypothetical protein [Bacillus phage BillyBob]
MNNLSKIASLKAELEKLEKEQEEFNALSEDKQLAITLHELMCNWNHTDGCGWGYETNGGTHNWDGYAHKKWLEHAQQLIKLCAWDNVDLSTAVEILKMGKGF